MNDNMSDLGMNFVISSWRMPQTLLSFFNFMHEVFARLDETPMIIMKFTLFTLVSLVWWSLQLGRRSKDILMKSFSLWLEGWIEMLSPWARIILCWFFFKNSSSIVRLPWLIFRSLLILDFLLCLLSHGIIICGMGLDNFSHVLWCGREIMYRDPTIRPLWKSECINSFVVHLNLRTQWVNLLI